MSINSKSARKKIKLWSILLNICIFIKFFQTCYLQFNVRLIKSVMKKLLFALRVYISTTNFRKLLKKLSYVQFNCQLLFEC